MAGDDEPRGRGAADLPAVGRRDPADALAVAAVDRPRGEPRPGGPAAAHLPRPDRRVRCRGRAGGDPRRGRGRLVRPGPAELREAHPDPVPAEPAGCRRAALRRRVRRPGTDPVVRDVLGRQRGLADRRVTPAPGRQRPAVRAVPGGSARLRDQCPHRRRERRDGRGRESSGRPSSPSSAGAERRSRSGSRR